MVSLGTTMSGNSNIPVIITIPKTSLKTSENDWRDSIVAFSKL